MLLFTEAHLEYNAGLVISLGSSNRPSPIEATSAAETLAEELEDYRQQLLAMAVPPVCPTEASQGGSPFTPLIGVPMEHSLDLAVAWALFGRYMCRQFWPMPEGASSTSDTQQNSTAVQWPKRSHPGALTEAGRQRTPWLTSWARATFEQGCLSALPHLEGPCKAISLPGEHLFQASRIAPDSMRPAIFHAFGKAKADAHDQLARLARFGWETLPIALLGMPHYPAAWSQETWKPIGGCSFTGGPGALTGNSAFRVCLLLQWHAVPAPSTTLFPSAGQEEDSKIESARTVSETNQSFLERSLLTAVTDQNSRESGSSPSASLPKEEQDEQASRRVSRRPTNPQQVTPALFVPWQEIATPLGIPVEHEALTESLRAMFQTAIGILTADQQRDFHHLQGTAFSQLPHHIAPVETTAELILCSMYEVHPWVSHWETILWHMAQTYGFWLTTPQESPPEIIQINCGGLGGSTLSSPTTPTVNCTHPRVNGTCVYGPSLAPADRYSGQITEVAAGHTSSLHELATLMSNTTDPCECWEALGYGCATTLYRRTQIVLEASRQVPAHRRVPHAAFLSGLWWKLLSFQPARILMCLPFLERIGNSTITSKLYAPTKFHVEGFSAGSYTGATVVIGLCALFPTCPVSATLGAIAMPKGVMGALMELASPGQCDIHLIHAEDDLLCDWRPSLTDWRILEYRLRYTLIAGADKWKGTDIHCYWHWMHCSLPAGRWPLTELKLSHPQAIPIRDRMAAPLRLASWIRFETVMNQQDWRTAIEQLVPQIHLPAGSVAQLCPRAGDRIYGRSTSIALMQLPSRQ